MSKQTHTYTPGPWSRVPQTSGGDLIAREYATGKQMSPKGLRMIAFMMARGNSLEQDEANARLIAAAPVTKQERDELRAALEQVLLYTRLTGRSINLQLACDKARALLARIKP